MKIDIQKLDERISKLQEIRRIATDQELASILLEFVSNEDEASKPVLASMPAQKPEEFGSSRSDTTHDLVKDLVNGTSPEVRDGLWSRRR